MSQEEKSIKEKLESCLKFFKNSWCVDGEVKLFDLKEKESLNLIGIFELNDSKRGRFYVGVLEKK